MLEICLQGHSVMDFVLVKPPSTRFRRENPVARDAAVINPTKPAPQPAAAFDTASIAAMKAAQDVFGLGAAATTTGLTGVNRRWSERALVNKQGWISVPNRDDPLGCIVRNSSKHGALIELPDVEALARPSDKVTDTFTLVWLSNRVRSEANCTVRWRSKKLVGINFVGPIRTTLDRRG